MQIEKRNFIKYVLLNCLTLGIYSFVTSIKIGKEINALCKGDGEEPRYGYPGAWVILKFVPLAATVAGGVVGAAIGFILALLYSLVRIVAISQYFLSDFVFGALLVDGLLIGCAAGAVFAGVASILLSKTYYEFWWYKQADRLHLNANRFGLEVKEKGSDTLLLRSSLFQTVLIPLTIVIVIASILIPLLLLDLLSLTHSRALIMIFEIIICIICFLFGTELTGPSTLATYFIIKNLNRYADVYRNGAAPFDPMAYEYYPSVSNKYPNFIPGMIDGNAVFGGGNSDFESRDYTTDVDTDVSTMNLTLAGCLVGINGSCAGYKFDLTSGEEIIIGKDARVSMVVIDPAYKEVSRKHVGVCYDIIRDQYRVVDYSSNGTWANGRKLIPGQEVYLPHGTELKLANDKNIFRLD